MAAQYYPKPSDAPPRSAGSIVKWLSIQKDAHVVLRHPDAKMIPTAYYKATPVKPKLNPP